MHLPFIQVANEAVDIIAIEVAIDLEADEVAILGGLVRVYRWALQRCPDHLPPSASAVVMGPNAAKLIAKAAGFKGDAEQLVSAYEAAGVVDRVPNGIRICGLDRYDAAWGKSHPELWKLWKQSRAGTGPEPGRNGADSEQSRAGTGPEPVPQKQTQKQTQKEEEAGPAPENEEAAPAEEPPPSPAEENSSVGRRVEAQPEDLRELWNVTAHPSLPRWRDMTEDRRKKARQRLKERPLDGPEGWEAVITRISSSAFCRGETDRGEWRATPDWLLKPGTAAKVLEGQYDSQRGRGVPGADVGRGTFEYEQCPACGMDLGRNAACDVCLESRESAEPEEMQQNAGGA